LDWLNGTFYDVPDGPYPMTGTFRTSDFYTTANFSFTNELYTTSGSWSGTLVPDAGAIDLFPSGAAWDGSDVVFSFAMTGPPTNAATHTTAVSSVQLYWADGPTAGDILSGPFADNVPVYWNSETCTAKISSLPLAPLGATHLLVYADAGGTLAESNEANNIFAMAIGTPGAYDFGDAPIGYGTLLANNGARHVVNPSVYLGSSVDTEADGAPGNPANGDDAAGADDEDGVVLNTPLVRGQGFSASVTASQAGRIDAWIDFNRNGVFDDPSERFVDSLAIFAGTTTLTGAVPQNNPLGPSYARYRFSTIGGLGPTGWAGDGEVEDYLVMLGKGQRTPGVFDPAAATFYLRNSNNSGFADAAFGYGPGNSGWQPLAGDWNGDATDTIGLYAADTSTFYLRNANGPGVADLTFGYGPGGLGWQPISGDWNGDGVDTIGLYDPSGGVFYLRNANAGGYADVAFAYGPPGSVGWRPVAGDWNADGVDTIGLYDPGMGVFYLRNSNASGNANIAFSYGPGGLGWRPLVGDWDGDGADTPGVYDPANGVFYFRDSNDAGAANTAFAYGPGGLGWLPIVSDWNGPETSLFALGEVAGGEGLAPLTESDLEPIVAQAIADWASLGLATDQLEALVDVRFVIADLPGAQLGLAERDTIFLDFNAAGHGWFIDPTPASDEEFIAGAAGRLTAIDPAAVDRIDLLTVVSHELGHTLGLEDVDATLDSLMGGVLESGVRRGP
jgi:hypothetical protein